MSVKSSQVKSSSNFNGGRARRLWGARRRERSGGRGAAQQAWLESPEPGLYMYPHRLLLDHRGAPIQLPPHYENRDFRLAVVS